MWILEPCAFAGEAFKAEGATIGSVTAFAQYLEHMELREKLEDYRDFFWSEKSPGDENLAREYGQVYDRVLELLSGWKDFLGAEKADMKNYIQILDAGFQEIRWVSFRPRLIRLWWGYYPEAVWKQ